MNRQVFAQVSPGSLHTVIGKRRMEVIVNKFGDVYGWDQGTELRQLPPACAVRVFRSQAKQAQSRTPSHPQNLHGQLLVQTYCTSYWTFNRSLAVSSVVAGPINTHFQGPGPYRERTMLITSCARNLVLHPKYIAGCSRAILEAASELCWKQGSTRCRQTFQPVFPAGRHRRWKTASPDRFGKPSRIPTVHLPLYCALPLHPSTQWLTPGSLGARSPSARSPSRPCRLPCPVRKQAGRSRRAPAPTRGQSTQPRFLIPRPKSMKPIHPRQYLSAPRARICAPRPAAVTP